MTGNLRELYLAGRSAIEKGSDALPGADKVETAEQSNLILP
jgi:hypothetical protein